MIDNPGGGVLKAVDTTDYTWRRDLIQIFIIDMGYNNAGKEG
jgi:hypothetical protein